MPTEQDLRERIETMMRIAAAREQRFAACREQRDALLAALRALRDFIGDDLDEMVDSLMIPSRAERSYPERRALIPADDLGLTFVIELELLIETADAAIAKVAP